MKKIAFLILILSFIFQNCEDPNKGKEFAIFNGQTIGAYLEEHQEFSLWVSLLKKTNLFNSLTVQNTFTCFAVRNEAVQAYLASKNCGSVEELDEETAAYLVRYHTVMNNIYKSESMSNGKLADTTASGDYLITRYTEGGQILVNESAKLVSRDLEMTNGILHVIDAVLDPVVETAWQVLQRNEKYSIFAEAVEKTGYVNTLNDIRLATNARNYVTVFVVPDEQFKAAGIANFEQLADTFAFGNTHYTDSLNLLNKFVGYHIMKGMNSFNDLAEFDSDKKLKNVSTYAIGELLMIEDISGELIFNRDYNGVGFRLGSAYNIQARNGILHEMDGTMPIFSPSPTYFKLEFTDATYFPEFAGLSWYHKGSSAGQGKTDYLTTEDFPYIRWQTVPEGGGRVWYETRATWSGFFDNYDVLAANMGSVGWWEMDLPSIVKGKYKVAFQYHFAVGRGTYQVSFDGKNVGAPVVFGATGSTYTKKISDMGIVNFTETGEHTIRFTVVSPGNMELDYITFTPVND